MSVRMMTTVDDELARRIKEAAGENVSAWLATAARRQLDREIAEAYENIDLVVSDETRADMAAWDAMAYPDETG